MLAAIIDGLILTPVTFITGLFIQVVGLAMGMNELAVLAFDWASDMTIYWLYSALLHSSSYQATLGKRVCGLYVTDLNGQRISFGRATGRYFAEILSGLILGIGYIMAGLTERKQALHDMIANTLVFKRPG